jgi:hypothetical protein
MKKRKSHITKTRRDGHRGHDRAPCVIQGLHKTHPPEKDTKEITRHTRPRATHPKQCRDLPTVHDWTNEYRNPSKLMLDTEVKAHCNTDRTPSALACHPAHPRPPTAAHTDPGEMAGGDPAAVGSGESGSVWHARAGGRGEGGEWCQGGVGEAHRVIVLWRMTIMFKGEHPGVSVEILVFIVQVFCAASVHPLIPFRSSGGIELGGRG